jgi:iron complex outermembrane receptor protein
MLTSVTIDRLLGAASALALLLAAAPVMAQPAAAPTAGTPAPETPRGGDAGEVVVTAQFREQNLQRTPIAITAVNAAMLQNRGQTDISQVANQAPNVTLKPQSAAFGPSLGASIRGVGQYDFNPALEPGVGMYVDDVYYSTLTGSILDLLDLDRVEILRGPQGTLAGKNSIGGAVKLYSKRPTGSGSGFLQATYGGLNRLEARGSFDFALIPDKLMMRVAAVTRHQDGYVRVLDYACDTGDTSVPSLVQAGNCELGKEGGKSYSAVRAALRWAASDKIDVNLIADYTHDNSENPAGTLLYSGPAISATGVLGAQYSFNGVPQDARFIPADPYVSYASYFDPGQTNVPIIGTRQPLTAPMSQRYKGWGVSGTVDWTLADKLALKSITAWRAYTTIWGEDNDASPLPSSVGIEHLTHSQFSQELRLNGSIGNAVDYTVGGFYFRQKSIYGTHQDLNYAGPFFDFLGNDPIVAHTKAGFAHAIWHVTDRLNFTGGVRYTAEDKDYTYSRLNRDGTPFVILSALNGLTGHYEGDRWDWRANVDYTFTPGLMAYFQYSTGFKGGGVNPRPFTAAQVQPFGPETLQAWEVGFKSQFLDRRVRLNAAAFLNKYDDIQLTLLSCPQFGPAPACALPQNAGNATVKGFEVETEVRPMGGLQFDGSLSYLDFRYDSINALAGGPTQPNGVQLSMTTPYTPKWKWSLGAQYEFDLSGKGSLIPRVDVSYQSAIFTNAVNTARNRIPAYTTANARLTWRSPNRDWEAAFEVTNLTDKLYYLTKFDLSSLQGVVTGQPALPREWALTVRRNF